MLQESGATSGRELSAGLAFALLAMTFSATASANTVRVLFDFELHHPCKGDRTVDGGVTWYLQDPGQFHFIAQAGSPAYVPASFYTFCGSIAGIREDPLTVQGSVRSRFRLHLADEHIKSGRRF